MRKFLVAMLLGTGSLGVCHAQTSPGVPTFYVDCLRSGGSPASVGDYPNVVVMPIYNGKKTATTGDALRFSITVAPSSNKEAAAVFTRDPAPLGETADFIVRQGRTYILSATKLTMNRTDGGQLDICVRQF